MPYSVVTPDSEDWRSWESLPTYRVHGTREFRTAGLAVSTFVSNSQGFTFHGDHLVCPEGKVLRRRAFHRRATGGIEAISMWLVRRIASDVL